MAYRSGATEICPACRAEVPAAALETKGASVTAVCPSCAFSWTFDSPDFVASEPAPSPPSLPDGWVLRKQGGDVVLVQRQPLSSTLPMGLVAVVIFAAGLLLLGEGGVARLASVALLGLGSLLGYGCAFVGLNRHTVCIGPHTITVTQGPLPGPGTGVKHAANKEVLRVVTHSSGGRDSKRNVDIVACYVELQLHDGTELVVGSGWPADMEFLHHLLEKHLGLQDTSQTTEVHV